MWASPRTWVNGELVTASVMNSVRDNFIELRRTPYNCCVAFHSAQQAVTASTTATLNLDSEELDTALMHDNSTNNNRITIPSGGGGKYRIIANTSLVTANGNLLLRLNGSTIRRAGSATGQLSPYIECYLTLASADYLDLAGEAGGADMHFGSATAASATRLTVVGPWPA